ncbi:tetratricopeptide repeat protein [bacterium]|nr:tetratricopeptide repeat protein [bacterium]
MPTRNSIPLFDRTDAPRRGAELRRALERASRPAGMTTFETAIAIDPSLEAAYVQLAELQSEVGDEASAERTLRRAVELAQPSGAAHHALGLSLVRQGRDEEAIPLLAEATRLAPHQGQYPLVLALAQLSAGRRPDAVATLEQAVELHPEDAETRSVLDGLRSRR